MDDSSEMIKGLLKILGFVDRLFAAICGVFPKALQKLIRRFHRILTFGFIGVLDVTVDFAAFFLTYRLLKLPIEVSQGIGFLCGSINGFMLNSNLTFLEGKGRTRGQFFQYVCIDAVLFFLSSYAVGRLEDRGVPVLLNKSTVTLITGIIHYVLFKLLVFRITKEDKKE